MVGDIKGYCILNKDADLNFAMNDESGNIFDSRSEEEKKENLKDIWLSKPLRCLEINEKTNSILALSSDATKMGMFDMKNVASYFHCDVLNGVVLPPDLDFLAQGAYYFQVQQRKGGYGRIVANMVIAASLHKGEFQDSFLWEKQ